jgi:hypothetical protein
MTYYQGRSCGGGGLCCGRPGRQGASDAKINILNEKLDFLLLNILKLSHHNEGKAINFGHFCSSL